MRLLAKFKPGHVAGTARDFLAAQGHLPEDRGETMFAHLSNGGISLPASDSDHQAIESLAQNGFITLQGEDLENGIEIIPCRASFKLKPFPQVTSGHWKMARLAFLHAEEGCIQAHYPGSDCYLRINDSTTSALLSSFAVPRRVEDVAEVEGPLASTMFSAFARAGVIQSCDKSGKGRDDTDPTRMQWELHEAVFHAGSRLGSTDKPVGATWSFRGQFDQEPAIKENPWRDQATPLPKPDLSHLMVYDVPLTRALETRRSVRHFSITPPSSTELGALLYRTMRVREVITTQDGSYASKPYPGGGAIYENEIYVTINQCLDLVRGFYYYDPMEHTLCRISDPDFNMEGLLQEAQIATAGICRPQILITIAARHNRFGWKYSGMGYAAQLKNIGVIYQTLYLTATAMGLGGCALGLGNSDRLCNMAGLDWWQESSVGEFVLGRPF